MTDSLLGQEDAAQLLFTRYQRGERMHAVSMGSSNVRNEFDLVDRDVGKITEKA